MCNDIVAAIDRLTAAVERMAGKAEPVKKSLRMKIKDAPLNFFGYTVPWAIGKDFSGGFWINTDYAIVTIPAGPLRTLVHVTANNNIVVTLDATDMRDISTVSNSEVNVGNFFDTPCSVNKDV